MTERQLDTEILRAAYSQGCFPMADDDGQIQWYTTQLRALLPIEGIRTSKSLARTIRKETFEIRFDTSFEKVVRACIRPTGNWISEEIVRVFSEAFKEGWAHCAECWKEGRLVGGVYGVSVGKCFSAESMFHRHRDASKVALWAMVNWRREQGDRLFDAQIMNPHLASLGAFEVPQAEFLARLEALAQEVE